MGPPALLALLLGTLGVAAALPSLSPSLSLPPSPELGTPFNVTCATDVPMDDVTVTTDIPKDDVTDTDDVTAARRSFPVSLSPDRRRATAAVTVHRAGDVRLDCSVRAGGREGTASGTVHVFYVPEPLLNVTPSEPVAGATFRGRCWLPAGATRDVVVRVLLGDAVLQDWGQPPLAFGAATREDEEELQLRCQAELGPLLRNSTRRIRLRTKPHLDPRSCPAQQNWTEGQDGILRCQARGWPQPGLSCSRKSGNSGNVFGNSGNVFGNFSSIPPGIRLVARREHAGIYRCRATNAVGTAETNVTLWVQYQDPSPLLPALLGSVLPLLTLLGLAGFYLLHRRSTRVGQYWLWRRQPPLELRPPRPPGAPGPPGTSPGAAPNGAAAP